MQVPGASEWARIGILDVPHLARRRLAGTVPGLVPVPVCHSRPPGPAATGRSGRACAAGFLERHLRHSVGGPGGRPSLASAQGLLLLADLAGILPVSFLAMRGLVAY